MLIGLDGLPGFSFDDPACRRRRSADWQPKGRKAIGADPRSILLAVLRRAVVLAGIGIAVGIVLAVALSRGIRSQLFGVSELEPWAYLPAAGLLAAVVVLASLAPAVRATRMNPVDVLRAE